uniref:Uncharacterized protein n=1 Tax=Anguilla anguilla TaxID=7936 RepID=A0A0E9RM00_ANGAN
MTSLWGHVVRCGQQNLLTVPPSMPFNPLRL